MHGPGGAQGVADQRSRIFRRNPSRESEVVVTGEVSFVEIEAAAVRVRELGGSVDEIGAGV